MAGGGGQVKFYPYKKRGGGTEKVLAMLKEGGAHKGFVRLRCCKITFGRFTALLV